MPLSHAAVSASKYDFDEIKSHWDREHDTRAIYKEDVAYFNADHSKKERLRTAEQGEYPPGLAVEGHGVVALVSRGGGEKDGHIIRWYVPLPIADIEFHKGQYFEDRQKWWDEHCNPILKRRCFRSDKEYEALWTYRTPTFSFPKIEPRAEVQTKRPEPKLTLVKPDTAPPEAAAVFVPTPFAWTDPTEIAPREWLYDQHLIRKYVSGTISPGGVGKSALKLAEALSMATGRGLLTGRDIKPLRVWYWNGEDPEEETRRRVAAACKHYGISREQIGGRLFLDSGRETKIVLAKETKGGLVIGHPVREALVAAIKANRIDVFIVDPFVSSHQVSENDNSKINDVVNEFREIADTTNCAIELVHHSRKTGGAEVTAEDSRGGGALVNAFRSTRVLNQMSDDEARKNLVDPAERRQFFRVDDGKVNLAPYAATDRWFRFESVLLGNGRPGLAEDNVGVVTAWKRPKPSEGLPSDAVQKAIAALGDGQWRENMQSKDWVGVPIGEALGLDPEHAGERMRINSLIREWIAAAYLEVFEAPDEGRRPRKFVRPRPTDYK